MWTMPADRSRSASLLTDIGTMQSPESWSPDGRVLAFKLGGKVQLPALSITAVRRPPDVRRANAQGDIQVGRRSYDRVCSACHGENASSVTAIPDLRYSNAIVDRDTFINGKGNVLELIKADIFSSMPGKFRKKSRTAWSDPNRQASSDRSGLHAAGSFRIDRGGRCHRAAEGPATRGDSKAEPGSQGSR